MRTLLAVCAAVVVGVASVGAQAPTTVFRGRPTVKISEGGVERTPEQVPRERAVNLECVISRIGDSYYWASRENLQLSRIVSGAFTTYVAINGTGYVRILSPEAKAAASAMSGAEKNFDYVEHALVGLRSVTYYGTRQ